MTADNKKQDGKPAKDIAAKDISGRRMVGGRWRDPEDLEPEPARADAVFSVRMTKAELAEFDAAIAELGLKRNRAMRIAARQIAGFVEVDAETLGILREAQAQIKGIATNINQIARLSNRMKSPQHAQFFEEREKLGPVLARLQGGIQRILDLDRRRHDGLARLQSASEASS